MSDATPQQAEEISELIASPFLEKLGMVIVPATTSPFVVCNKFVVAEDPVKIIFLGSYFKEWFFGKTEDPQAETILRYAKLTQMSLDGFILGELGDKAEVTLAHIYALMERQAKGQEGVLLTNGETNIFYCRDINGALRVVHVYWGGDGWGVYTGSGMSSYPYGEYENRVFSRS